MTCCLNCRTELQGGWCHRCGQRAGGHARSLRHVALEGVEVLTHADSRLWRTLRRLAFEPARLTRDYAEGRRVSEIPPMRMFLIVLVLLFATGSFGGSGPPAPSVAIDHAELARWLAHLPPRAAAWLQAHIERAAADPRAVLDIMRDWSERFAFLMLPLATSILCLLFIADRRATPYDHAIFSLHSLSFSLFVLTLFVILDELVGDVSLLLLGLLPLHLWRHMRGLYGTGPVGTLVRMTLLGVLSLAGGLVLLLGLVLLGLQLADG